MDKIVFVSAVRNFGIYDRLVRNNPVNAGAGFVCFDNLKENIGVASRYNSFLDSYDYSEPAWFVFCHEDWQALQDLRPKLRGADRNCLYGPVGMSSMTAGDSVCLYLRGFCRQCDRDGSRETRVRGVFRSGRVDTFDCQCLIVHSSLVEKYGLRFDGQFTFDLYVEDFCIGAYERYGIVSKVLRIDCRHWSYGEISERFRGLLARLSAKCRGVYGCPVDWSPVGPPELLSGRRVLRFSSFFLNHPEKYWLILRYGRR